MGLQKSGQIELKIGDKVRFTGMSSDSAILENVPIGTIGVITGKTPLWYNVKFENLKYNLYCYDKELETISPLPTGATVKRAEDNEVNEIMKLLASDTEKLVRVLVAKGILTVNDFKRVLK